MENTSILVYLLKSTVAFTALYGLYLLLFKKNQQFAISRFYLVFTIIFASLFPFIKFINYKTIEVLNIETLNAEVLKGGQGVINNISNNSLWSPINLSNGGFYLYLLVSSLILVRLLYMLIRFGIKLSKHSRIENLFGKRILVSDCWNQTFSFFGIIVLPQKDFILKENQLLIQHELAHVKQYHSLDLLLAELFLTFHWFNPLAYIVKKDMREVHEFLADSAVVDSGISRDTYQQLLINYLSSSVTPKVANSFSAKLLKKRFAMMTTNKKSKSVLLKYLLIIPVITALTGLMSFQTNVNYVLIPASNELGEKITQPYSDFMDEPVVTPNKNNQEDLKTKLLNIIQGNKGTYLKDFQMSSENMPIILKQGVTYRFYMVWSGENRNLKNNIVLTKENKDNVVEVIKPIKTFKGKEHSYFDYFCENTGAYKFGITNYATDVKYAVGLCMLSMDKSYSDNKEKVEVIEFYDSGKTAKQDTLVNEEQIFVVVEDMPKFDNKNLDAAREYIAQNVRYPKVSAEKGIQGRVYVSFVVEKDGSVSGTKIERGVDPDLDKEAIRVIKDMPKWTPGYQKGKAVSVKFTLPVIFKLGEEK